MIILQLIHLPPSIVRLVMNVQIRSNATNGIVEWPQLDIPSFQIDGNYESMTADGVSNETLTGMALSVTGQQCMDGDVYGYIKYVPVAEESYLFLVLLLLTPSPFFPLKLERRRFNQCLWFRLCMLLLYDY